MVPTLAISAHSSSVSLLPFSFPYPQLCLAGFYCLYLVLDQETPHTENSSTWMYDSIRVSPTASYEWPRQVTSQIASEGWKGMKMGFYLLEILVSPNLIHLYHGYNSLGFFSPFTCSLSPSLLPHLSLSFSLPPFHPLNCNPMSSSLPRFSTLVSHSDPLICPFVQSFSKNPSLLE